MWRASADLKSFLEPDRHDPVAHMYVTWRMIRSAFFDLRVLGRCREPWWAPYVVKQW